FNVEKLEWMNGQHLRRLPAEERARLAREFLGRRGIASDPALVDRLVGVLGGRIRTPADLETQGGVALGDALAGDREAGAELVAGEDVAARLEALAAELAALSDFTPAETERATRALAQARGIKPGELMAAARVALTGKKVSPGL